MDVVVIGTRTKTVDFVHLLSEHVGILPVQIIGTTDRYRSEVSGWADMAAAFPRRDVHLTNDYAMAPRGQRECVRHADLAIVLGWTRLIPPWLLNQFGDTLGAHAVNSFLPEGRGRSPINWSIIGGADHVHLHIMQLKATADTGDVWSCIRVPVNPQDTVDTVQSKCVVEFAFELKHRLREIIQGPLKTRPQGDRLRVHPKRTAEMRRINWGQTVRQFCDFVRAQSSPYPPPQFLAGKIIYIILSAQPFEISRPVVTHWPGRVVARFEDGRLVVELTDGYALIATNCEDVRVGDVFG